MRALHIRCWSLFAVGFAVAAAAGCPLAIPSPAELTALDGAVEQGGAPPDAARDAADGSHSDGPAVCPDSGCADAASCGDAACAEAGAPPTWWNAAWKRRRQLTITNSGAQPLPAGVPVVVAIDLAGGSTGTNQNDVRVCHAGDAAAWRELERHVDADLGDGRPEILVSFRLVGAVAAGASDASYWLYYDSPGAGWPGNGAGVFELLEVFAPAAEVDAARWVVQGSATPSWGLKIAAGSRVRSAQRFNAGRAVDVFVRADAAAGPWGVGFQRASDFADGEPYLRWRCAAPGDLVRPEAYVAATGQAAPWQGAESPAGNTRHFFSVARFTDQVLFALDLAPPESWALPASYGSGLQLRFDNDSSTTLSLREVHVREAFDPAPVLSVGPEEPAPAM